MYKRQVKLSRGRLRTGHKRLNDYTLAWEAQAARTSMRVVKKAKPSTTSSAVRDCPRDVWLDRVGEFARLATADPLFQSPSASLQAWHNPWGCVCASLYFLAAILAFTGRQTLAKANKQKERDGIAEFGCLQQVLFAAPAAF